MKPTANQIICGNNIDVVKSWPANCIDGIVTDPPYGLGFMGKDWDTFNPNTVQKQVESSLGTGGIGERGRNDTSPAWNSARYDHSTKGHIGFQQWFTVWAKAMLRITKPGGFLLCFGGPRTYHRLACAIEDAGWEIRDCMMWLYGTGFPKSHNISKAIEKAKGVKPVGKKPAYGAIASRELIDNRGWNNINNALIMPETQTDLAKLWSGYGTALKPAWEPIIVAMKPLDGTFAHNAEHHGVAGLNIDAARIGTEQIGGGTMPDLRDVGRMSKESIGIDKLSFGQTSGAKRKEYPTHQGRWPANLILDEEAEAMLDEQTGTKKSGFISAGTKRKMSDNPNKNTYGKFNPDTVANDTYGDSGGASRFFYCAKTSRKERNMGCKNLIQIGVEICVENTEQVVLLKKDISELIEKWLIGLFGKKNMDQSQTDFVSTTKTGTNKITILTTSNLLTSLPINDFILDAIKTRTVNGGNPAVNVENIKEWKPIFIKELTEYLLGVSPVALKTPLKINVNVGCTHPTLKPLALMKYLCTLLKMPSTEQIILDPFLGSGTTAMACASLGIGFIGIEKELEYCEISAKRIAAISGQTLPVTKNVETFRTPKAFVGGGRCPNENPPRISEHRQSIINAAAAALRRNRK